jgi:hypothetical protein
VIPPPARWPCCTSSAPVELVAGGAIDTAAMLPHELPLERFGDALDIVRRVEGVGQVLP